MLAQGREPSDALVAELQVHVKRVTAPYKYPREIEFVAELPKTPSGKVVESTCAGASGSWPRRADGRRSWSAVTAGRRRPSGRRVVRSDQGPGEDGATTPPGSLHAA